MNDSEGLRLLVGFLLLGGLLMGFGKDVLETILIGLDTIELVVL